MATRTFWRKWKGKGGKNEQKNKKWNVLEEVVGKKGKEGKKKKKKEKGTCVEEKKRGKKKEKKKKEIWMEKNRVKK